MWHCHKLSCRSQAPFGPHVAMAVVRLAATAPIQLLAWEPPYATGAALKRQKKKGKEKEIKLFLTSC